MSLFGLFLLIIFGYFIIWPVVKVLLRINAAKRQFRDMMNGGGPAAAAGFGAGGRDESRRKGGWSRAPRRRRKKIPDDTGEYVAFEEITVTQTVTESTAAGADGEHARTDYTVEQQIIDVEWEDVK